MQDSEGGDKSRGILAFPSYALDSLMEFTQIPWGVPKGTQLGGNMHVAPSALGFCSPLLQPAVPGGAGGCGVRGSLLTAGAPRQLCCGPRWQRVARNKGQTHSRSFAAPLDSASGAAAEALAQVEVVVEVCKSCAGKPPLAGEAEQFQVVNPRADGCLALPHPASRTVLEGSGDVAVVRLSNMLWRYLLACEGSRQG